MFKIGLDVEVRGHVRTVDEVLIDGIFDGVVEAPAITVSARATCRGSLVGERVIIDGIMTGDVFADEIRLGETATVRGRLFHARLGLQAMTFFEGQSRRYANPRKLYRAGDN